MMKNKDFEVEALKKIIANIVSAEKAWHKIAFVQKTGKALP